MAKHTFHVYLKVENADPQQVSVQADVATTANGAYQLAIREAMIESIVFTCPLSELVFAVRDDALLSGEDPETT